MSWFTEIAGRAEDLLNKVDQTAATALQTAAKTASHHSNKSYNIESSNQGVGDQLYSTDKRISSSQGNLRAPSMSLTAPEQKSISSPSIKTRKKSESDDEKLLKFLNSDPLPTPPRKVKEKTTPNKIENHISNLEDQTTVEPQDVKGTNEVIQDTVDGETSTHIDSKDSEISSAQINTNEDNSKNENSYLIPLSGITTITDNPTKNISSTNEELLLAHKRADYAESEMKRMTKKLDHWNSQISGNDKNVRELQEREKDMMAAMDAKDSQIAILKVRLHEADQELSVKKNVMEELKTENDMIIKEHAEMSSVQNKTIETLQQQLQQVEIELLKTKDSMSQTQTQHMQQVGKMEEEHRHLVESYSTLQKKWSELNERSKDISLQLKLSNGNFGALQQEYNDYKQKAQRILQSKEKLIASLKEGNLDLESIEKNEASSHLLNVEIEAVKQERDLLRDEIRRANELVETYRSEMQDLEKISQNDMITSQERCKNIKELLDAEKIQKEEFQQLNSQLKEEIQFLREDLARTKNTFQSRVQDREIEIEKLRRQLTAKSLSTVSQEELESRLHALTENLIQKQTIVEALSTEKNSLVLQLERQEQHLREAQSYAQQHAFVGINSHETERKSKAVFLDNPFDSNLTRRVKKVYGTIDSFSIRLGVFFRRYPISRVFVIIYMLLLHFWVLFVLLTYEPEIHNSSHDNPQTL